MDSRTILVGEYVHHSACRFCQSQNIVRFLDLGYVPLAGGFLAEDEISHERLYPLEIYFCGNCTLVQVTNAIAGNVLFSRYFYFSSAIKTLSTHFEEYAKELKKQFLIPKESFAVEIGCNDGVLLKPLQDLGVKCLGVDPATNVVQNAWSKELNVLNEFFTEKLALQIRSEHGQADVILSSNSFAHIDDMLDVMRGVKALLRPEGVLIIEVHYLGTLIEEMQYDMLYHEHLNYYSVKALANFFQKFEMEIFDIRRNPIHGGSIRCYVREVGRRKEPISEEVKRFLEYEGKNKLSSLDTYIRFAERVQKSRNSLMTMLEGLKGRGKKIIGYGASGRATTIMNYCGIDSRYLDYIVDDAPVKQGYFTPGTHLPIKPWPAAEETRPDYVLVFAWSFFEEIKRKRIDFLRSGGKFILPLPEAKVISD